MRMARIDTHAATTNSAGNNATTTHKHDTKWNGPTVDNNVNTNVSPQFVALHLRAGIAWYDQKSRLESLDVATSLHQRL